MEMDGTTSEIGTKMCCAIFKKPAHCYDIEFHVVGTRARGYVT